MQIWVYVRYHVGKPMHSRQVVKSEFFFFAKYQPLNETKMYIPCLNTQNSIIPSLDYAMV